MSRNIKHVGQILNTQKRCVVVFRELPDDPTNCLVVDTDALPDWMHDDVNASELLVRKLVQTFMSMLSVL